MFATLLNTSISGGIVFLIWCLSYPISKKVFNASWHYAVLKITMAFLLLPIGVIANSLLKLFNHVITIQPVTKIAGDSTITINNELVYLIEMATVEHNPIAFPFKLSLPHIDIIASFGSYLLAVWFVVMVILFAVKSCKVYKFKKQILHNNAIYSCADTETYKILEQCIKQVGLRQKITLKVCSRVKTPLVMGIFKPIIIFPDMEMSTGEKELALTHELTHIKNYDLCFKFLAFCIPVIHWFNPLVYLLCRKVYAISEIHCDECIVTTMTTAERKAYGNLILKTVTEISAFYATVCSPLSTKTRNIERRLLNMMNFKKSKKGIFVLSLVVALVLTSFGAIYAVTADSQIIENSIQLSQDGVYVADRTNTHTDDCTHGRVSTSAETTLTQTSLSANERANIIADIESGKIQRLTKDNAPERNYQGIVLSGVCDNAAAKSSAFEIGNETTNAACAHVYCFAHYVGFHSRNASGGCTTNYYDSAICHNCGSGWTLAFSHSVSYRVCPH